MRIKEEKVFFEDAIKYADFLLLAKAIWATSLSRSFATVFYRLPSQLLIHSVTDFSHSNSILGLDIETCGEGFVCHPFLGGWVQKNSFFIKSDLHITWENEKLSTDELNKFATASDSFLNEALKNLGKDKIYNTPGKDILNNQKLNDQENIDKNNFIKLVTKGIEDIKAGQFQKVVLSRLKKVKLSDDFNPVQAFQKLCRAYPNAFVSLTYLPGAGIWLGASPETLVSVDKDNIFRTVALAGTQAYDSQISPDVARWSMKEIEEQALVARYIVDCFKKVRVREYIETGPKTIVAGNLIHLKTDFFIDTEALNFKQLPSIMLDLLHPTSAVCGMPKENALAFIKENETHDRELYSGYLGPVNIDEESHLFVNLRCLKLQNVLQEGKIINQGTLFAGAGITAQSNPEREWMETELKCQTILNVVS